MGAELTFKSKVTSFILAIGIAILPPVANAAVAGGLVLQWDYSSALAVLDALDHPAPATSAASKAVATEGVVALVAKQAQFDAASTAEAFKADLVQQATPAGRRRATVADVFRLSSVANDLADQRRLVGEIQTHRADIQTVVADRIRNFAPADMDLAIKVVFVEGGSSDGWTDEAWPNTFFIDLNFYKSSDLDGLSLLMSHELFHLVQAKMQPFATALGGSDRGPSALAAARSEDSCVASQQLLLALMNEGTASLVGDASHWPGEGPYLKWFREKFARNLRRSAEAFELFNAALYRVETDPSAKFSDVEPLLFSGTWDDPGYFVGYRMASTIDRFEGRQHLISLLSQPPSKFYLDYAALARARPENQAIIPLRESDVARVRALNCLH